jgi:hypothetical protein
MGISWEDQVEACWAMKVVRLASVKWEVRYSVKSVNQSLE